MIHITLVTWTNGNYGTAVQAYAMCRFLSLMGTKVVLISSFPCEYNYRLIVRQIKEVLGLSKIYLRAKGIVLPAKSVKYNNFLKNYVPIQTLFYKGQLERIVSSTDLFITGSDQIWNTYHKFNSNFFLSFVKDKRRIAYSSSIGTDNVNPTYATQVREYLMKFEKIGVREQTAVKALKNLTGRQDIIQVLDPVFLLGADEWMSINPTIRIPTSKYMLCYCVGANDIYVEQVKKIAKVYGVDEVYIIPSFEHPDFFNKIGGVTILNDAAPQDFVHFIRCAEVVCTDSFHATALSMIFNREFVELKRFSDTDCSSQNSRIYDLLESFGISDRMYEQWERKPYSKIDYQTVNEILSQKLEESILFLKSSIL